MLAQELIDTVVAGKYRQGAHVRAMLVDKGEVLDSDTVWFHVHRDEELPNDHPVVIYVRV